MNNDDYEHFTESVGEQLFLMLMTAVVTMAVVGIMLAFALQKGDTLMSYEPPLEDDIALGKDEEEEDDSGEPDRMWGDE